MGITSDERVRARIERKKLAFDHNIWALPLQHRHEWEAEQSGRSGATDNAWAETLGRLAGGVEDPAGSLRSFGMVRAVTDGDIVLVKRDRPELWTATAAREDAEATSVQLTLARGA